MEMKMNIVAFNGSPRRKGNTLLPIVATRLAVVKQVTMTEEELSILYDKLELPAHRVKEDYQRNQALLKRCYEAGKELGR